ncbi:adenosylcobinamide-GDP ribazoletransferase, partial [uncultured Mitsuokella sp.]
MRSFITALQFLTRIHLVRQENLTAEDFGRSTRFFPLVGAVLGALYLLVALACLAFLGLPSYTGKAILVLLP